DEAQSVLVGCQFVCPQLQRSGRTDTATVEVEVRFQPFAVQGRSHDSEVRPRRRENPKPVKAVLTNRESQRHGTVLLGPAEQLLSLTPHHATPLPHVLRMAVAPFPG